MTAETPIPYAGGVVPRKDTPTAFSRNAFRELLDGPLPTREHPGSEHGGGVR
ncbi:hypothetical protein [Allokutzneria oryzae]|uniref:Uncharacterized protein n=1 Tax=Allokutzneria oryzae TaxID=1378989 RepID=A0ABV6A6Z2_9PSEU